MFRHLFLFLICMIAPFVFIQAQEEQPRDTLDVGDLELDELLFESSLDIGTLPLTLSDFISQKELQKMRKEAESERLTNPLFLDWVFLKKQDLALTVDTNSMISRLRAAVKQYVANTEPELFLFYGDDLPSMSNLYVVTTSKVESPLLSVSPITLPQGNERFKVPQPEKSQWISFMNIQVQATQNYISSNWYNGGESNMTLLSNINAAANYDNNKNLQWDNTLLFKSGFNSSTSDTIHKLRANEDLINITSKLGIKAVNKWFYTASADLSATFFNTFLPNSHERTSGFLSPIRFNATIGMDFKYKKTISVLLSPLAFKLVYVNDTSRHSDAVKSTIADKVGIEKGENTLRQFGSSVVIQGSYSFSREIRVDSKMKFYTNYKGIEWDWEIIGNFIINRFLSTRVAINPRFDNTVKQRDNSRAKLQFKEYISIGFNYLL